MKNSKTLQKIQAPLAGSHFLVDDAGEPQMLASETPESLHQRHIGNDVDHVAIDVRSIAGVSVVKWCTACSPAEHDENDDSHYRRQAQRHRDADSAR